MKETLGKILRIFTTVLMVLSICMMIFTVISVLTFNRSDRQLFGYRAFIVLSDSMSATDFKAGDLANVLDVTVKNGDTILCSGKMSDLTRNNMQFIGSLPAKGAAGSRLDLTISFYFPKDAGNTAQNGTLQFDLCADGTQVKNNPSKEF